ncbi:MAG: hypothetical protein V3U31_02600 [Dehalococcoidia bacterium]
MKPRWKTKFLILTLVVVMALSFMFPAPVLAAPTISASVAVPSMVSLFGDIGPAGGTPDSPLGPGWTTFVVDGPTSGNTVTIDLKAFFLALLPSDMASRIPSDKTTSWNSYLTGLETTSMVWDGTGSIWKYAFELDNLFQVIGGFIGSGPALNLVLEDLRLGAKTVSVSASNGGTATGSVSLTVVDAQVPLRQGWNAGSFPFALSNALWGTVRQYGPGVSYDVAIRWDAATTAWVLLTDAYSLSPLEGFFIHATADTQIGAILNRSYTAPPTRSLSAGWNLVGSAPDFIKNFSLYYPKTGTGAKMRGLMKADDNFISLLTTSSGATGYTMVLSVGQDAGYTSTYKYGTYSLSTSYPWLMGQPAWGYTTLSSGSILADPITPDNYFGWVVPFGAYWVYMENADTLAGFTSTPLSKQWLATARQTILGF